MKTSQQECFEVYDSTVNSYTFFYFHSEKEKNLYAHLCKSYCMDHIHIPG